MSIYEKHVFVCVSGKTCPTQGSEAVWQALRDEVKACGKLDAIRVNKSGCLAQCGHGPMVVVYPEQVWYGRVTVEDAPKIVHDHLLGDAPVERLRYVKAKSTVS
ncbi:MAG: (2Fe-2S) ferredoxin domain-containing protein [Chloracidobacterium sp.]|uniref:(2Fe-2S) ferredoxin domain-containing protein n=1 Tax=Chloracidobacterium validum TaxID=2821543 RepID=A0ABX8B7P5_9BACT|nr:(2Fe-2S) ferredoxin domain-containing protein [Chloracidobacterium validum]QUW02076.1 (2Fe-2S) ferredoxin domain-containing protein [Chloracidobacterium validum]